MNKEDLIRRWEVRLEGLEQDRDYANAQIEVIKKLIGELDEL